MRTAEEIKQAIEQLKEIKPKVRKMTAFGDDNHAAIEAQILVLTETMTEDQIWDEWPEDSNSHERIRDNALDAYNWMTGERDILVEDWRPLAK